MTTLPLSPNDAARIRRIAACSLVEQRRIALAFLATGAIALAYSVVQLTVPRLAMLHHPVAQWSAVAGGVVLLFLGGLRYAHFTTFRLIQHLETERARLAARLPQASAPPQ